MRMPNRSLQYFIIPLHTGWIFAAVFFATAALADDKLPQFSAEDLAHGKRLFNAQCAICHSIGGTGGRGPDLTMQPFRRVQTDDDLLKAIREGLDGTEMPSIWMLNETESLRVAGYVRSLSQAPRAPLTGDPKRGAKIYAASDCSQCHIVSGKGRGLGPELTAIGARRNPDYLRRALAKPDPTVIEQYALVSVDTSDNRHIEGVRLNEDTFTLQLRDIDGAHYSFRKADLKSWRLLRGKNLMPDYSSRFSASELDDLVAYLAHQKGSSE